MCKFCGKYYDEEEVLNIDSKTIDFGMLKDHLLLDMWMIKGKLECYLVAGNNNIESISVPIKYCPFCGNSIESEERS